MALSPEIIKDLIKKGFPDGQISLTDLKGNQDYYLLSVTSVAFEGKNLIQQHKMVYAALGNNMETIHALTLKTQSK